MLPVKFWKEHVIISLNFEADDFPFLTSIVRTFALE